MMMLTVSEYTLSCITCCVEYEICMYLYILTVFSTPIKLSSISTSKKEQSCQASVDSKFLFCRPIISLRLFSDATLFFGVRGLGIKTTSQTVRVFQKRGEITVMDGFAANNFNHGINRYLINEMSVSVLICSTTYSYSGDEH